MFCEIYEYICICYYCYLSVLKRTRMVSILPADTLVTQGAKTSAAIDLV